MIMSNSITRTTLHNEPNQLTHFKYVVASIEFLSDVIYKVILAPVRRFLNYSPGQYCKILCSDGIWRSFSIADIPKNDNCIELIVRAAYKEQKKLIHFNKNQFLTLSGPYGHSFLDKKYELLILVAKGMGIAPCKAIMNSCLNQSHKIILFWSCDNIEIFASLLNIWKQNNNFYVLASDQRQDKIFFNIHEQIISKYLKHISKNDTTIYISGSTDFVGKTIDQALCHEYTISNIYNDMM